VVIYPGGFGTLDEMSETLTLIQTNKIHPVPLVLVNKKFWAPLIDWFKQTLLAEGLISEQDLDLFIIVDTPEEAMELKALADAINTFLRSLSKDERNLFIGRYYFLDSLKDAARYCGMSEGKAKSMLFRTRCNLKAYLQKEGFDV
jgi:RNA polymerase sigma factor (sigma-70 family)